MTVPCIPVDGADRPGCGHKCILLPFPLPAHLPLALTSPQLVASLHRGPGISRGRRFPLNVGKGRLPLSAHQCLVQLLTPGGSECYGLGQPGTLGLWLDLQDLLSSCLFFNFIKK